VRKLGFAGAPMHDALLQRLQEAFRPSSSSTTTAAARFYTFSINQRAVAKPGSPGRAGLNTRLRVVKLDSTDPADSWPRPVKKGQIIADLPATKPSRATTSAPTPTPRACMAAGTSPGDTGYVDADGDLYVTGRVDDMIISGGENISPVDIESVLSLHPAVDEVAVAGLPDERWGQKVVAFVKTRAGGRPRPRRALPRLRTS
jgi:2-furoate---CoA ligase